ncbi:MAG TPA: UDP-3-O-(3-hydroxymyristoyl)glucosamine N-acyltransferase, partial [Pseudomonadales bacterium]|nr:UDP-3-O-(3-hydroxymyristoyl)glucosamine N-acyltransferase [Pseudomonadales bacterium]
MAGVAFTLAELAKRIDARVEGDPTAIVTGLGSLATASPGQLTHLSSRAYRRHLPQTRATAVILRAEDLPACPTHALVAKNPYLAFARASMLFSDRPPEAPGVHPTAVVDPSARLGAGVAIGPHAVVGARCIIGARVEIGANTVVGAMCELGDDVRLMPNATLYHRVRIGARSVVHSGAVIGADGFGFAPDERGRHIDIAQIGGVAIGADVSIGAATTIDRGAIDDTSIGDGVKIDNQVQIGHNTIVGEHTVICGCVGIVGSTRIGRHCVLAGGVGVGGDGPIEIADRVVVSGMTHVSRSIDKPGVYSGGVLHSATLKWKRNALRFAELDELAKRIAAL